MKTNARSAETYADIILNDEREKIVTETPTTYTADKIERIYEFDDGAVVKYEWQSPPAADSSAEKYNHRFTLIDPPTANSGNLKKGIIRVIDY